jgi:polysaccharide export outer membrane protein
MTVSSLSLRFFTFGALVVLSLAVAPTASAQSAGVASNPATAAVPATSVAPPDYVIGPDDVLSVSFWRDKDLSADVVVRPDGKVSLQLVNEVQAAGLTPEQFRVAVAEAASKFVEDPTVTVVVKQINSRKVFVVGEVNKPGTYVLGGPMTVLQLIALAGGLSEYADKANIVILRAERRQDGEPLSVRVNYNDLMKRKNLKQNIELKPGDTVMVP